jgi:hypothetical protein
LKCGQKWACMGHLDICKISYGKKKVQGSNWQFDSQPLKVGNWPDLDACSWSATHCRKALKESYKFALDLIPIGGLSKELWSLKILGVQTGTVSGFLLGSPETKNHSDVGAAKRHIIYCIGEGGGFPRVRAVVNQLNPELPVVCPSTKGAPECELTNLLVGLMHKWIACHSS